MNKAFSTWTHRGVQFIALPRGANVHIADANGNNYGGWYDEESFRKHQVAGDNIAQPIGRIRRQASST